MDYEDRLIIYIDVLGFSDFVNYTTVSMVNTEIKIQRIESFLNMIGSFFRDKHNSIKLSETKKVTSFSDLIIVSINLNEIENIDLEIMDVFYLLLNATNKGFLLRGSIVYGKLIHTDNVIFGSGLIDAYNREKTIAKYPRVIIDNAIVRDLSELGKDNPQSPINDVITCDDDGQYYIDMFKGIRTNTDNFWQYAKILSAMCTILIEIFDNPILKEKRDWLLQRFISHIENNTKSLNYSFDGNEVDKSELSTFRLYLTEFDEDKYKKLI